MTDIETLFKNLRKSYLNHGYMVLANCNEVIHYNDKRGCLTFIKDNGLDTNTHRCISANYLLDLVVRKKDYTKAEDLIVKAINFMEENTESYYSMVNNNFYNLDNLFKTIFYNIFAISYFEFITIDNKIDVNVLAEYAMSFETAFKTLIKNDYIIFKILKNSSTFSVDLKINKVKYTLDTLFN
jgi:hypothetical protein